MNEIPTDRIVFDSKAELWRRVGGPDAGRRFIFEPKSEEQGIRQIPAEPPEFVVSHDLEDLMIPGVEVEVDAETAEELGAFEETALSDEAAAQSNEDLADLLTKELSRG